MIDPNNPWLPVYKRLVATSQTLLTDLNARRAGWNIAVNPNHDVRFTTLGKIGGVLGTTSLGLAFVMKDLSTDVWWKINAPGFPVSDWNQYIQNFDALLRRSTFIDSFSAVEASIRAILRGIDLAACSGALGEFKNVYECLLKANLSQKHADICVLFDLLRLIRNTMHNNFVFMPRSGNAETVVWKGVTYTFVPAHVVSFGDWNFVLDRIDDLVAAVRVILDDPVVAAIPNLIRDNYIAQTPQPTQF
jgi:hypothetical protein